MMADHVDLDAARAFLRLLDPEAHEFTFQIYPDSPNAHGRASHYTGSFEKLSGWLSKSNANGAGVFAMVNAGNGKGRGTDNVVRVRSVFADLDGAPLPPVLECRLVPHFVVETSPGRYHAYWLVDSLPKDLFAPVQKAIAHRFGSDPAVHDLPRVARIPGFYHCKDSPWQSRILTDLINDVPPYSAAQILAEFPASSEPLLSRAEKLKGAISSDPVVNHLKVKSVASDGRLDIVCPFENEHTKNGTITSTSYYPAHTGGFENGHFVCKHAHCAGRTDADFLEAIGFQETDIQPLIDSLRQVVTPVPPRFNLLTADDLLKLPPIRWRIRGVFPETGLSVIFGPSGSGKSFLILDMAMALSEGRPWFGNKVKSCPVIYCALEGEAGIAGRVNAYAIKHGSKGEKVRYLLEKFNLLKSGDVQALGTAIIAVTGGEMCVVILDTLNRAAPGADENDSKDMGDIISASKALQDVVGGLVVLVHHTGKDVARGMRGHSSLRPVLDGVIEVTRDGDVRGLIIDKSKDGEDGISYPFRLEVVEIGEDEDCDPITSCVVVPEEGEVKRVIKKKKLSDNGKVALDALNLAMQESSEHMAGSSAIPKGVTACKVDEWRKRLYRWLGEEDKHGDTARRYFNRAKTELVAGGYIQIEGMYVWILLSSYIK